MQKTAVSYGKIKMLRWGVGLVAVLSVLGGFAAQECANAAVDKSTCVAYTAPDPLGMWWTFGAHEPYTMYRRMGVRSTGGIHGNCYWLPEWFKWWDSEECPELMEELGLNWLLCRFYKGMGWEEEKKDFPNVKRFVENCHKHGVKAVAYVQFSTVYPETMKREIPDLEKWTARRSDGRIYYYSRYFRWEPCFNEPAFEEYLRKVIRIALVEGGFDGVFFDNAYMKPCFCNRCQKLFHEHLMTIKNPADRFGFDSLEHFGMPEYTALPWGEVREPLLQEFNVWRTKRMTALFKRFYDYAHAVRRDCIVAANICPYRAPNTAGNKSVDMTEFPKCFDLVMGQADMSPHLEGDVIVNRVRDLKYAREFAATYFASCDGAAGDSQNEIEETYLLPMVEDVVFGGAGALQRLLFTGDAPSVATNALAGSAATVYYLPGREGWSASLGGRPALLWNPAPVPGAGFGFQNGVFGFTLSGTALIPVHVQAAANLTSSVWYTITNTAIDAAGTLHVRDPESPAHAGRYYRVVWP